MAYRMCVWVCFLNVLDLQSSCGLGMSAWPSHTFHGWRITLQIVFVPRFVGVRWGNPIRFHMMYIYICIYMKNICMVNYIYIYMYSVL